MSSIWDFLGGRKFVAFIITIVSGIAVHVFSSKGVTTELVALFLGAAGTFSAANAIVTATTAASPAAPEEEEEAPPALPPPPVVDLAPLTAQLAQVQTAQVQLADGVQGVQKLLVAAIQALQQQPK